MQEIFLKILSKAHFSIVVMNLWRKPEIFVKSFASSWMLNPAAIRNMSFILKALFDKPEADICKTIQELEINESYGFGP